MTTYMGKAVHMAAADNVGNDHSYVIITHMLSWV